MRLFLPLDTAGTEAETGAPPPERVLEGDPRFTTWNVEATDGGLYAGIWEATPGKWRIIYDEWEFCRILSGLSIVAEEGGEARTSGPATASSSGPASRAPGKCLKRLARNTS